MRPQHKEHGPHAVITVGYERGPLIIQTKGYSRVALLGNPSDGFEGKTIGCLIRNFSATVDAWESPELRIYPNPEHDPTQFESLTSLRDTASVQGYYGGMRLILAASKRFADMCVDRGIHIPARNFTIRYDTDIPRQVGLAGSSAIITAAFQTLMQMYNVPPGAIPMAELPNLILQVETEELDIQAGLQDRVICVYGGLVYMDFSAELLAEKGHGDYVRLDPDLLPPLFIAWGSPAGESGKAHSPIRTLWEHGDETARAAMTQFAEHAAEGWEVLRERDRVRLGELMNASFDLRLSLYGPEVLGRQTMRLVEIARAHGCPAKLPGSGGAIVGLMPDSDDEWRTLVNAYTNEGFAIQEASIDHPDNIRGANS